jgi:hypothetical protein
MGGAARTISLVIPVSWVTKGGIGLPGLTVKAHSADLGNRVVLRVEAGSFDVYRDDNGHGADYTSFWFKFSMLNE